jgi:hypothetical protein
MNGFGTSPPSLDGWGPVPLGEVLGAVLALKRREFRRNSGPAATSSTPPVVWRTEPGEVPVVVLGCGGSTGATTVALLLAEAAGRSRVVECAPGGRSGLAGASTAELGATANGWVEGSRGDVRIQRRREHAQSPDAVPLPVPGWPGGVTVVDAWWDLRQVLASGGWLADLVRGCPRVVLVARATLPGMRQLESDLALVEAERCWAVATCLATRLPRTVEHSLGVRTSELRQTGRLISLPDDRSLALSGITTEPLPRSFTRSASLLTRELLP